MSKEMELTSHHKKRNLLKESHFNHQLKFSDIFKLKYNKHDVKLWRRNFLFCVVELKIEEAQILIKLKAKLCSLIGKKRIKN